jgi:ubiquinone/menaquinone biosynthesis C-methylase UbiE
MDIFFDIHKDLPREGPGDSASTRKALSLLKTLPSNPLILDIGCGPGMQTLDLARSTSGKIVAVDNHQPFLDQLQKRAQAEGLAERISVVNQSMFELQFPEKSFDLLWSEGAIYIIGFEQGLRTWRQLLRSPDPVSGKPGGCAAVTEISWLKPNPPEEVHSYWMAEYPGMRSIDENLQSIRSAGYREISHFTLPPSSWWTDYYNPIEARLPMLREKYHGNTEANNWLDATQKECDIYRRYSDRYGYVFYVMQVDLSD